jgi:membrane dipeptidase
VRKVSRRAAIAGGIAVAAGGGLWWSRSRKAPLGMEIPDEYLERGAALLADCVSVDVHSHPGRSFLVGSEPDSLVIRMMRDGFEAGRIADMRGAKVTASIFSVVADFAVLGLEDGGLRAVREFEPGEAHADFNRQLDRLLEIVDRGLIKLARSPQDIRAAKRAGEHVALFASEGGDFIDDRLERLQEAYAAGLRSVTLVHYHVNQLGDIQTEAPVHDGLTPFGREVVQEMNRLGMIVDVAHASYATCKDVVAESRAPVMLSHSNLDSGPVPSSRFISNEHARMIADAGGIIGAWPSGIGSESLADFADQVLALVNAVGVEHVAIGTDMDGNYKPVLDEYADFPLLAAGLLFRGLGEEDVARVLGSNFLRLFDEVGTP